MAYDGFRKDYALTPAQKADARAALHLLEGTGLSLTEAARRAVEGKKALRKVTLVEARDEFVRSRLTEGNRAQTVEWYEYKLAHCMDRFSTRRDEHGKEHARLFADITRPEFFAWIKGLAISEGLRAAIVRACRALWRWGMAQEPQLATVDVTAGLKTSTPARPGEAEFLTVPEVAAALAAMGPYRSGAALLFFGGVRPEELWGVGKAPLLWRQVRVAEKLIRIPAEIGKTAGPRVIEGLPPTVWAWLEPGDDDEPVSPGRTRQIIKRARNAIRRLHKDPNWQWPHDATRHTFATYMFAVNRDAGEVAAWLGHAGNQTTFHRHYKGLGEKADGKAYLALRPG